MAGLDGCIDLLEIQQAIGSAHLVHLGVDARGDDLGLAGKAEILEVVDALLGLLVVHDHGASLNGVIDLGGMEREGGHVACIEDALAIDLHTEGMGGIIDDMSPKFKTDTSPSDPLEGGAGTSTPKAWAAS